MGTAGGGVHRPGRLRRWLAGRTLRGRLIAGVLGLLAVACAAVGIATYGALHSYLIGQLDAQLVSAAARYADCLHHRGPDRDGADSGQPPSGLPSSSPQTCAEQQLAGTFTGQIRGGTVTTAHVANGRCDLSAGDRRKLAAAGHAAEPEGGPGQPPGGARPFTRTLSGLGSYRLVAMPEPPGAAYLVGLPMSSVTGTLRTIEIVAAAGFAAALALTGFAGTGFVRLSLRPLRRVAATATRVAELPLASGEVSLPDRVPYANPRTEVGQVGSAFNRMLGHVEAALARRAASENRLRRFAADASHELRTPLAAIRGYAELTRRHPGPIPADIAHALSRVESESARMTVLVDELLLLAQLDAGRPLAKEPVDLTRLAIDATSDARAASGDHRWLLDLPDEPVLVTGDGHRLHQVLANLMSNAARHTPPGTAVTVAVAGADHQVRLSVTDDGPGIAEDLRPALFERFVRGDSARSGAGGSTGLGLAIVQAVTTAHGGSVTVTSRPGRTSFVIILPRPGPPAPVA
jgi:two-component system OmpR family sensor kinase